MSLFHLFFSFAAECFCTKIAFLLVIDLSFFMVSAAKSPLSHVNTGGSGENKDPNLPTTFQRIHEMIGAPILKEIEEYQKQNLNKRVISSTGSMASPDGAPLIVL